MKMIQDMNCTISRVDMKTMLGKPSDIFFTSNFGLIRIFRVSGLIDIFVWFICNMVAIQKKYFTRFHKQIVIS